MLTPPPPRTSASLLFFLCRGTILSIGVHGNRLCYRSRSLLVALLPVPPEPLRTRFRDTASSNRECFNGRFGQNVGYFLFMMFGVAYVL